MKLSDARDLLDQLKAAKRKNGSPMITDFALHRFRSAPTLPFAAYYPNRLEPMGADNAVWFVDGTVTVELYTALVDFELLEYFEGLAPGYWIREDILWLDTENCYMTIYNI